MKLRVVTEKPGWILHRKAEELKRTIANVRINQPWPEADIHYYINYGFYNKRPSSGIVVGNFTHYEPEGLGEKFFETAREMDYCIAVSQETADDLVRGGIPREKVSVIPVGADAHYRPKMRVGIVGRIYANGRKGEDLVRALVADPEVLDDIELVATAEGWGVPVETFQDRASFYRSLDYLLVSSTIEGGPVPFMEALACGVLAIAPPIGVVPQFPHIEYPVGDIDGLKFVLRQLSAEYMRLKAPLAATIKPMDWDYWAIEHRNVFRRLLRQRSRMTN